MGESGVVHICLTPHEKAGLEGETLSEEREDQLFPLRTYMIFSWEICRLWR